MAIRLLEPRTIAGYRYGEGTILDLQDDKEEEYLVDRKIAEWYMIDSDEGGATLIRANNLADLPDKSAARVNLGLGSLATQGPSGVVLDGSNAKFEIGSTNASNTPYIDFHSSGLNTDYDSRIMATGGSAGAGAGSLFYIAGGGHRFSGNAVPSANGGASLGVGDLRWSTLNTHTIPEGTGTLALRSDIPFINIKDYGAGGDGVTNNFQAITDAIAAANGRKILVPMDSAGGDYAVTSGALALTSAVVFEYEAGAKIRASGSGSITNTGSREIGFGGAGGTNNQGSAKSTIGLYISTGAGTSGFSPAIENSNNAIWIQNDTVDVEASGGSKSHGLLVDHRYGSSTTKGGRIGLQTRLAQLAATSTSNSDRNYTAVVGNSTTSTGDGGAAGSEKGAYFGLSGVATLAAGATDTLNATGAEFNTYVFTGASTKYRTGIQIVGGGNVRGSNTDCAISVYNHSGAVTFKDGICFGGPDEAATFSALDTTGTAFRMRQTTGITNLIDCTAPVSGNILSYLNGLHNVKITPTLFQGNSQSFGLELGRVAAVNSPFIDFHSSGNGVDYDTRIHSSGGTASVGQGTLNYTAATHSFVGGMKFGTFTADAGATIAGYITITDAAGNSRKLLVAS